MGIIMVIGDGGDSGHSGHGDPSSQAPDEEGSVR